MIRCLRTRPALRWKRVTMDKNRLQVVIIVLAIVGSDDFLYRQVADLCEVVAEDIADLRERMAHLEGLSKGFTRRFE